MGIINLDMVSTDPNVQRILDSDHEAIEALVMKYVQTKLRKQYIDKSEFMREFEPAEDIIAVVSDAEATIRRLHDWIENKSDYKISAILIAYFRIDELECCGSVNRAEIEETIKRTKYSRIFREGSTVRETINRAVSPTYFPGNALLVSDGKNNERVRINPVFEPYLLRMKGKFLSRDRVDWAQAYADAKSALGQSNS